jgi:hypothetical protein
MQITPVERLLGDEGFASGRGDKCPSYDRVGGASELPVFTPRDFSLSESEDMVLFYPQT